MARRGVSLVMLALGAALGVAAFAMSGANAREGAIVEGGTVYVALHHVDSLDPAIAYFPTSWLLLDATCAKLMNYPDRPLPDGLQPVPEVAARRPISPDGRTYTFTLRRGFRFSNGRKLDASSFEHQITRILELKSGGVQYVQDIVGADDVLAGRSARLAGVVARGRTLKIRLTHPVPDFTARLAMPFFCAVPPGLPADPEGARAPMHSAGPYYVAEYLPGRRAVLKQNPYYGGKRRRHVERFVVDLRHGLDGIVDEIESGRADWGHLPPIGLPQQLPGLKRRYGLNQSRLFIRLRPQLFYFVLNTEGRLFRNNAPLRRAINWAVNRSALAALYRGSARPTDQYLPIGFPGFRDARIYPNRPNVKRARKEARDHLRGGKAVLYTSSESPGFELAQVVRQNLARINLDVVIKAFPRQLLAQKLATRGEPFDIGWSIGWTTDYSDPYSFINVLLEGSSIGVSNLAYFNLPKFNRRMRVASRLPLGRARYRAYGSLDIALARGPAPLVAYATGRSVTFVTKRLGCKILRPDLDLATVCLKR